MRHSTGVVRVGRPSLVAKDVRTALRKGERLEMATQGGTTCLPVLGYIADWP